MMNLSSPPPTPSIKARVRKLCLRLPVLRRLYPYFAARRMFGKETVHYNMQHYGTLDGCKNPFVPSMQEALAQKQTIFSTANTISIVCPLYNTPQAYLFEMLQSVLGQTNPNWELCLSDASDKKHNYVKKTVRAFQKKDRRGRIRYVRLLENKGISQNTNAALQLATGQYIALLDHDDVLNINALFEMHRAIEQQHADLIFSDECIIHEDDLSRVDVFHLKPNYAPDTLRTNNYFCHFLVFSRELMEKAGGGLRHEYDGSQDFDLVLRLSEKAKNIVHVQKLLYFWRSHESSVAGGLTCKPYVVNAAQRAIASHLHRVGLLGDVTLIEKNSCIFKTNYVLNGTPPVSLIITDCGTQEDLQECVASLLTKSSYPALEILVVSTHASSTRFDDIAKDPRIHILFYDGDFHPAAMANRAAKKAGGEYLLFLDSTTHALCTDFVQEMLMFTQRDDVGAVGAKLCYPSGAMRHTGLVLGLGGTVGNSQCGIDKDALGFMSNLAYARNVTAVMKACLFIRRSLFFKIGNFNENFVTSLEEVDLCLRLRKGGFVNVYTPFSVWVCRHAKPEDDRFGVPPFLPQDNTLLHTLWGEAFEEKDAYFNHHYRLDTCELKPIFLDVERDN